MNQRALHRGWALHAKELQELPTTQVQLYRWLFAISQTCFKTQTKNFRAFSPAEPLEFSTCPNPCSETGAGTGRAGAASAGGVSFDPPSGEVNNATSCG